MNAEILFGESKVFAGRSIIMDIYRQFTAADTECREHETALVGSRLGSGISRIGAVLLAAALKRQLNG
jgi:hypothetical protein